MNFRLDSGTELDPPAMHSDPRLNQLYTGARDVHAPTAEQWARMAANIDAFAALPSDAVAPAPGRDARPLFHRFRSLLRGPAGLGGAGVLLLCGGFWSLRHTHLATSRSEHTELAAPAVQENPSPLANLLVVGPALSSSRAMDTKVAPRGIAARVHFTTQPARARVKRDHKQHATDVSPPSPAEVESALGFDGPKSSLAESPAADSVDDSALLHDLGVLNRVEALLRKRRSKDALSLLNAQPLYRLHSHGAALAAAAQCQLGEREAGLKQLQRLNLAGPLSAVQARAMQYCGISLDRSL